MSTQVSEMTPQYYGLIMSYYGEVRCATCDKPIEQGETIVRTHLGCKVKLRHYVCAEKVRIV